MQHSGVRPRDSWQVLAQAGVCLGPLAQAAISENSQTKFHALNPRAAILLRPGFIIGSVRNPSHLMCSCQHACNSSATALALLGTGKSGPGIFQLEERSSSYLNL